MEMKILREKLNLAMTKAAQMENQKFSIEKRMRDQIQKLETSKVGIHSDIVQASFFLEWTTLLYNSLWNMFNIGAMCQCVTTDEHLEGLCWLESP